MHFKQKARRPSTKKMASLYDLLGVLLTSFGINLIPFAGPSNLLIAANAALIVKADPWTIGFLVAMGSASAKLIHYVITFFASNLLSEKRRKILDAESQKVERWAFPALFVAAATPIPDEPVIIPLGLLKYNPVKFYLAVFLGKLSITIIGAYLGMSGADFFSSVMSQETMVIISVLLTIAVTVLLLKVDMVKILQDIKKRIRRKEETGQNVQPSAD
jgi:membrane protein DedA with SNARE-associated domain